MSLAIDQKVEEQEHPAYDENKEVELPRQGSYTEWENTNQIFRESENPIYQEIIDKYFVPKDKEPQEIIELDEKQKKMIDPNKTLEEYSYGDIYFTEDVNDPDYMKNKVSYEQYKEKEKHFNQAYDIYGEDSEFNNIFSQFAPELSVQFMDIKDIIRVVLETKEKLIVQYTKRNPRHGFIYRKIQEKLRMIEKLNKSLK